MALSLASLISPQQKLLLVILGVLSLVVFLGIGALYIKQQGYNECERDTQAALAEHLQRAAEQAQDIARQDAEISEYYERVRTRIVHTEPKIIEVVKHAKNADADPTCHLSDAELGLLNEARGYGGDQTTDPSQLQGVMPRAATPDVQAPQRREVTPLSHGPVIQRLRGEDGAPGWGREREGI